MNHCFSKEILNIISLENKEGYWCPICSNPLDKIYPRAFEDLFCPNKNEKNHEFAVYDPRFANYCNLRFKITKEDKEYVFFINIKTKTVNVNIYQNDRYLLQGALLENLDNFNIKFLIEQADTYLLFS